ncbi:MAG: TlpA family protein disulfide reductase [Chloroflexi bacterium]|nr:TlpA family protein disulfide reductase [Chloroflexota bacterium]
MSFKSVSFIVIAIAVAGFLGLMAYGLATKTAPTAGSGQARLNKPATDFQLQLFDGGQLKLSEFKGRPVVVNFWASWCPPCREEAQLLESTWRAYRDRGVAFVGVDIQDREADARAYIKEFGITYPNGPDPGSEIAIDYGVSGIPVTFFISRDGYIVNRWVGAINKKVLVAYIEELMR